jgi:peptide/nickel transport system permease protein
MIPYIARRVAYAAVLFLAVTTISFFLLSIRGGLHIARVILGPTAKPQDVQAFASYEGLLDPWWVQYTRWLSGLLRGDLGHSLVSGLDVNGMMATRLPVTLSLVVLALLLTIVFSGLLGVFAATRGGAIDRGLQIASVVVYALPVYWIALILVIVFGLNLQWFPATGYVPISVSFVGWLSSILLPSVAIAVGNVAAVAQQLRGAMLNVLREDYIRTLRSRGIPERAIIFRHALRNAGTAGLTILSLQVIVMLGGVVFVELIFALPGVGSMAIGAGLQGDAPAVMGVVVFMIVVVVAVNLLVDVLNGFLNPKSRVS